MDEKTRRLKEAYEGVLRQLQTTKEENKKMKEQYKWYEHYKDSALKHTKAINEKYIPQVEQLSQQNKQMREALGTLKKHCKEWSLGQTFIDEILKV